MQLLSLASIIKKISWLVNNKKNTDLSLLHVSFFLSFCIYLFIYLFIIYSIRVY